MLRANSLSDPMESDDDALRWSSAAPAVSMATKALLQRSRWQLKHDPVYRTSGVCKIFVNARRNPDAVRDNNAHLGVAMSSS